ncbi:MAG: hypothetical protein AAF495_29605 [Pseudomonadota bacterium]
MDEDRRALITHLMAEITARLEEALEQAVEGQSPKQGDHVYRQLAADISSTVTDVRAFTEAISAVVRMDLSASIASSDDDETSSE